MKQADRAEWPRLRPTKRGVVLPELDWFLPLYESLKTQPGCPACRDLDLAMLMVHRDRNQFAHLYPGSLSAEVQVLSRPAETCLRIVRYAGWELMQPHQWRDRATERLARRELAACARLLRTMNAGHRAPT
jgi:hypothetical protein